MFSFSLTYKTIRPKFNLIRRKQIKEIFGVGLSFFIIQISCIVLYTTANMIITHLFGPEKVTPYNIAYKYFSIALLVFNIILTPYWSAITEAFTKKDFQWIKNSMKYLVYFSFVIIALIFIMFIFSGKFYHFWIGDVVKIPKLLSVLMGIYFSMIIFMQPFVFFVNGTGKIRLQLIFSVLAAIINIPLSIYFAKYLGLGISGIILSIIFCSLPGVFYVPIQYKKIINKNAFGIWNK
jgi:O-antigen/teichoic acid export membrane protein